MFEHLCPLLIIKNVPLKTFNDLNSSSMYGHFSKSYYEYCYEGISSFLLNKSFCEVEVKTFGSSLLSCMDAFIHKFYSHFYALY